MIPIRLRNEKLEWLETGGEVIALDESELAYVSANVTGSLLWQDLAAGTTRDALVTRLVDAFEVDAETVRRDVDAFLEDLERRGLLAK